MFYIGTYIYELVDIVHISNTNSDWTDTRKRTVVLVHFPHSCHSD